VGIMAAILFVTAATAILGDSPSVMIQAFTSFDVSFMAKLNRFILISSANLNHNSLLLWNNLHLLPYS